MSTFRKTKLTPKAEQLNSVMSKALLSPSDTNIPDAGRKSRKSNVKGVKEDVIPHNSFLGVFPFLVIIECYRLFKLDLVGRGVGSSFNYDLFMLLVFVSASGKKGITCTGLLKLVFTCKGASGYRNLSKKLFALVGYEFVLLRGNRYYVSSRSVDLFLSRIDRKSFIDLNSMVVSFIKD